jgi:antitoxin VapB
LVNKAFVSPDLELFYLGMVDFYHRKVEMGLNIKKPTTEAAIRQLAAQTGQSLTDAVELAVLEKLDRIKQASRPRTGGELLARLQPLLDSIATERLANRDTRTGKELEDDLYDEHGLPK